jgi:hypothetical protein
LTLKLWVQIPLRRGVLHTTFCDEVCQWIVATRWLSPGTLVSSTNKTDRHDITEILLKVALSTIILKSPPSPSTPLLNYWSLIIHCYRRQYCIFWTVIPQSINTYHCIQSSSCYHFVVYRNKTPFYNIQIHSQ